MSDSIRIDNVTREQLAQAREFLARSGVQGFDGDSGALKADCFEAAYTFDAATGVLVVTPSQLPAALESAPAEAALPAFRQLVQSTLLGRPNKYGVYDYVYPTISNQSGGTLTYSSSNPTNGTIDIVNSKIANGSSLEAFEADSAKLSGTGVGGTCTYTLADGQTTLQISYFLNTIWTHTFTVGLQGGNAARYAATATDTGPVLSGYTYLSPTVSLTKVKP